MIILNRIKNVVASKFNYFLNGLGYYKVSDLQAGAHCGCCGTYMPKAVAEKGWAFDICDNCN